MGFLEVFRKLVMTPGPSGFEDRVREAVKELVRNYGRLWSDDMGNLVLEIGEGEESLLIAAHMDEVGLLVTHIQDDGLLKFRLLGGIDERILPSQHVIVHSSSGDIPGVIGILPPHVSLEKEPRLLAWHELCIDIGASSADEARSMGVRVLDPVTFARTWSVLGGGKAIATRSVDDRFGCALLVELARRVYEGRVKPRYKLYLAWTVQEELGLRGALALAHVLRPNYMIAVDTTSCCNPVITGSMKPGQGPTVRVVDKAGISNPRLARRIMELGEKHGIPLQPVSAGGGTDMAAFQKVNVRAVSLGVPVKYTHSTTETIWLSDVENLSRLLDIVLEEGL